MNVINIHLDFPRKRESCVDCGGQVWNVRKELSYSGKETCVDCGAMAGTCPHWLHLYTYLEPLTLMPLSHEIQRTSLRFQLERNASLEIHSDLLPPWPETPLSPSATLRSKLGYRCQFAPVWSSTRASHPLMYSALECKTTSSQLVRPIPLLLTTPSASIIQQPEICQQQQYPHQQLQQEQCHEQQQPQQHKHKQQKQQSLQKKLQLPASTRSIHPRTQDASAATSTASKEKTSPAEAATSLAPATPKLTAVTVPLVPASTRSIHLQTQSDTIASTSSAGAGVTVAATEPNPTGSRSAKQQQILKTSATQQPLGLQQIQSKSSKSPAPTSNKLIAISTITKARLQVVSAPILSESPRPQAGATPLLATAAVASAAPESRQQSQQQKQQSQPTEPKQPKQSLSPVTQALDNYLQGISIPSIDQSDLKEPPQGQVVLGQGAYGGVLMMLYNNQPVAVKCVPTGNKDTVEREVRTLSLLSQHDCFPNLHGIIEVGHFRAVAMQFIGDEASASCLTLGGALNGSRSLTLDSAEWRSIAMNVVDGIQHMHAEGLLHNDIKMDNILMSYDTQKHLWRAYVIDVGVATTTIAPRNYVLTSEEKERYRKFHAHIAPEMVDNGEPQSTQSDIFQLGYVLHSIGKFGAVHFLEQLGDNCKSRDPAQRPDITHIRYCIQNNTFI